MTKNEIEYVERFRQLKNEIRGSTDYLITGLDIGKDRHHAFFGDANGRTIGGKFHFSNDSSGFEHLLIYVQQHMYKGGFEKNVLGMEPTGVYHKPLAEFLIDQGYLVVSVTGAAVKNNRELLDGRWDKNDTKDAANVADLISQGKCQYYDWPTMDLRELRRLISLHAKIKRMKHGLMTRIRNNLIAEYFPELDKHWKGSEADNLSIVRWCLAPEKMVCLEFDEFFKLVVTKTTGLKQQKRLMRILQASQDSIGCQAGCALDLEAEVVVDNLRLINMHMDNVERTIAALCERFEEYPFLLSIPGFGPYVCSRVLAKIGNPFRFNHEKQVLRLAGMDLSARRSGKKSGSVIPVISKKGSAELRYALYQAALVASSRCRLIVPYFQKLLKGREREKGIKTKMRVKLASKLLVIAWTLMKKKAPFNPDHIK